MLFYLTFVKTHFYEFCWCTTDYRIRDNIFCDNRTCCNDCTITYMHPCHNKCISANPNIITNYSGF